MYYTYRPPPKDRAQSSTTEKSLRGVGCLLLCVAVLFRLVLR